MVYHATTRNTKTTAQGAPSEPVDLCGDLENFLRTSCSAMATPAGPAPSPGSGSEDAEKSEIESEAACEEGREGGRIPYHVGPFPHKGGMYPAERVVL